MNKQNMVHCSGHSSASHTIPRAATTIPPSSPSLTGSLIGLFLLIATSQILLAQTEPSLSTSFTVNNATETPIEGVGHDYLHDLSETVNPQNGQVSIRIAGPTPHERGLHFPAYVYMYDTSGRFAMGGQISFSSCQTTYTAVPVCIERVDAPFWANINTMIPTAPTLLGVDKIFQNPEVDISLNEGQENGTKTCNYIGPYVYEDPTGGFHSLNLLTKQSGTDCATLNIAVGGVVGYDPQYIFAAGPTGAIADLHGDLFYGDNLQSAEDTNGNHRNGTGRTWTTTTTTMNLATYPSVVTLPGIADPSSNQPLPYTYHYATYPINSQPGLSIAVHPASTSNCYGVSSLPTGGNSFTDVETLSLPNGQAYNFGYEPQWGLVNSITYPTGATVSYTWAINSLSESFEVLTPLYDSVIVQTQGNSNGMQSCYYEQDLPKVQTRIVSFDGVTPALEQDFSYTTTWGAFGMWTNKTTTVVTKDLIRSGTPSTITVYSYLPYATATISGLSSQGYVAQEDTVKYEDGSGTLLRTIKKVWSAPDQLSAECEILPGTIVSGKFYQYQTIPNYGMSTLVTDLAEYDSTQGVSSSCTRPSGTPPPAPARETLTQYATLPSSSLWNGGTIPQINDRPSVIQVYDHGQLASETDISYDQYGGSYPSLGSVSPAAYGHDESVYGSSQATARGNATTIKRKCLLSGCTDPTTTIGYDETGQITQVTDADHNTTSLSYADAFDNGGSPPANPNTGNPWNTNTYLTQIMRPATNGVTHVSNFKYNYTFGEMDLATDENTQSTYYQYNDLWGRPTLATYPDGGQIKTQYNDDGNEPSVTTEELISSNASKVKQVVEDGVGHPITSITFAPEGELEVDTTYDGMGRVFTVTNPYNSTGPASGIAATTYAYDALGRTQYLCNADNGAGAGPCVQSSTLGPSYQKWAYSGYTTTFTNEDGNSWVRKSDSFGRLIQVTEPNLANTYYLYTLGNLTCAAQTGISGPAPNSCASPPLAWRARTFSYDGLSRLISSLNPETGEICYGWMSGGTCLESYGGKESYDGNGNLLTKTDGRGVITQYTYDALNRLSSKSYQSAPPGSLASCFQYDNTSTGANGKGKLWFEWTQSASTCSNLSSPPSATTYQTLRVYGAYDARGREVSEQQCVAGYCTSPSVPTAPTLHCSSLTGGTGLQYCYDLAGDLLTYENGISSSVVGSYPSAAMSFAQTFDSAGRLAGVSSSWNQSSDPTHPGMLFSSPQYAPFGSLTDWLLGGHLLVGRTFDTRLRVTGQSEIQQ